MLRSPLFILSAILLSALFTLVFVQSQKEDPVQLALGSWGSQQKRLSFQAEVTEERITWSGLFGRGTCTYTWLQTEKEPYLLEFRRGEELTKAKVSFDGSDTAILEPEIFDKLPKLSKNRFANKIKQRVDQKKNLSSFFLD